MTEAHLPKRGPRDGRAAGLMDWSEDRRRERMELAERLAMLAARIKRGRYDDGKADAQLRRIGKAIERLAPTPEQRQEEDLIREKWVAMLYLGAQRANLERGAMKHVAICIGEGFHISPGRVLAIARKWREAATQALDDAQASPQAARRERVAKLLALARKRYESEARRVKR